MKPISKHWKLQRKGLSKEMTYFAIRHCCWTKEKYGFFSSLHSSIALVDLLNEQLTGLSIAIKNIGFLWWFESCINAKSSSSSVITIHVPYISAKMSAYSSNLEQWKNKQKGKSILQPVDELSILVAFTNLVIFFVRSHFLASLPECRFDEKQCDICIGWRPSIAATPRHLWIANRLAIEPANECYQCQ